MEIKELKKKTTSELHNLLAETREKMRELKFKDANHQLKNVREIRGLKKQIAQILTLFSATKKMPVVKDAVKEENKGDK